MLILTLRSHVFRIHKLTVYIARDDCAKALPAAATGKAFTFKRRI
jgi:hypothetical protein